MKAVRIHKHGGPEVLQVDEMPIPKPGPGDVLIKMKTAALNHLDIFVRQGIPGVPLPLIMGSDGAGIVQETGTDVESFSVGDEVLHVPVRVPKNDPFIKTNRENLSPQFKIPGEHLDGTQCDYMVVPETFLLPRPQALSWAETSAFPLASMTAYHMLHQKAHIQKNDWVLIYGASSGVGGAAIQIAKAAGARVISTAGNDKKSQMAFFLGADYVINYNREAIGKKVREITAGNGVDVIIEHPGAATWKESLRSLKTGGKLITCGATTGPLVQIDLRALFIKHQQLIGSTMGTLQDLKAVCKLVDNKQLKPYVGRIFCIDEIRDAHIYLENGQQMGKVVIEIGT